MLKTISLVVLVVTVVAVIAFSAYVRFSPLPSQVVQSDPEAAERTGKPNDFLVGPGGDRESIVTDLSPEDLLALVETAFMEQPRTTPLDTGATDGRLAFVQRSRLMGYPDVISVRVTPEENGSRLSVWSQSIYGQSDMGVNRGRMDTWLRDAGIEGGA